MFSPTKAQVLPTHTSALFKAAVRQAVELLQAGQVVALPTETVYGLAANALNPAAVSRIFAIKGRPARNPIIVHVASVEMARGCAAIWPELAGKLAKSFWPGPLTLVLPGSPEIPEIVTAGGATVGIRWPSHPFIQTVIRECGFPLAAPSANLSNELSATNPAHVLKSLGDKIPLIVDGGQSQVGIESTVLDLSVSPPRVLRPGMIHDQAILAVTGDLALGESKKPRVLKSPGQLARHYAPKARLIILSWKNDADLRKQITRLLASELALDPLPPASPRIPNFELRVSTVHVISHTHIPSTEGFGRIGVVPHDPEAFARALYCELHQCDEAGAKWIIVEALPGSNEWNGIRDRLKRASAQGTDRAYEHEPDGFV
jgi:L-threonylcarbamoyladenylate synthase